MSETLVANNQLPVSEAQGINLRERLVDGLLHTRPGQALTTLAVTAGFGGAGELASADTASAKADLGTPITQIEQSPIASMATVPEVPSSVTMTVRGVKVSANAVANKRVIFGQNVNLKRGTNNKDCHWTKGAFTNSVILPNGKLRFYRDSKRGYLCRNENSLTGWVKKAGGETGKPCWNPAKDKPMPKEDVKVYNIDKLNTSFTITAIAKASAFVECPGSWAKGSGSVSVQQKFNLKNYLRQSGTSQAKIGLTLNDRVIARARAEAGCSSVETNTPTPPKPQKHNPTVEVFNPNHVGTNGVIAFCETERDSDGYIVDRQFKIVQGGGNYISDVYPGNDKGEFCRDYRGPSSPAEVVLGAEVTDNDGLSASAETAKFPIVELPK